jgi:uncharacterized membrane protein YphA (DoxX/SURF4 family)
MEKLKAFSPVIVRIGIALVFIWFGINQLTDTTAWTGFVPQSIIDISGIAVATIVHLNGVFEIVFGAALLLGFFTRFAAFFLALHIIDITYIVGLDSIGVRDFGLSMATIAVWFNGSDFFTLDRFLNSGNRTENNG